MQTNIALLEKKAVELALKADWKSSIEVNLQILEVNPDNIPAKLRLGRSYINTEDFAKAKKVFKDVLTQDPINQIAIKNLEMANQKRTENGKITNINTTNLIMEPGTTKEFDFVITAKRVFSDDFAPGEEIKMEVLKTKTHFYRTDKKADTPLFTDTSNLTLKLFSLKAKGGTFKATFVKGKEKNITILVKTSSPIFKENKQEVRPYIKKGSLDEPELEIPDEVAAE